MTNHTQSLTLNASTAPRPRSAPAAQRALFRPFRKNTASPPTRALGGVGGLGGLGVVSPFQHGLTTLHDTNDRVTNALPDWRCCPSGRRPRFELGGALPGWHALKSA